MMDIQNKPTNPSTVSGFLRELEKTPERKSKKLWI
jgi:hypothetical protein